MLTRLGFVGRRAACALVLVAPVLVGCEQPVTPTIQQVDRSDTPEGHLTNVMRRLKFQLDQAKPALGSGVKSTRECTYKLIEPESENGDYTAEVAIKTTRALGPGLLPKRKKPPAGESDAAAPADDPTPTEPTDPATLVENAVYKLAYKNRRWVLVDPPQEDLPETERICFQYALSDG